MGVINKFNQQTNYESDITTISVGANIRGGINAQCDLHIGGLVNGDIVSNATVRIGETGTVNGKVEARHSIVSGHFKDDAECESIQVSPRGEIRENLLADSLSIDFNGVFEGTSMLRRSKSDLEKNTNRFGKNI